jgi:uncharacterized cupin superfamily protein
MSLNAMLLARQGKPDAPATQGPISAADPFAAGRQIAFRDEAGFFAGTVKLPEGETQLSMPHAEVLVVLAGGLTVKTAAGSLDAKAGQSLVLPRGLEGTLACEAGTLAAFNTMSGGPGTKSDPAAPIALDPALPRNPSAGPAPEVIIGKPPVCHSANLFTDASGMRAGVWDATTGWARQVVPHKVHELMHILEGSVTLTAKDGATLQVNTGDTLFLPRGAPYAWTSTERVVKFYVVL